MRFFKLALPVLLAIALTGCGTTPIQSAGNSTVAKLDVVTSISPLADMIRNVGGNKVQVTPLVKPGNDPHDYEPTPEDVRTVAGAAIFFANGLGEEPYLNKLVQNAGSPKLKVVTLSDGLAILGQGTNGSGLGNPHLWLDVQNAKNYVLKIRNNLSLLLPQDADYFNANAAAYIIKLDALDKLVRSQVDTIPPANRKMVVFHNAWPYFAARYGLQDKAVVQNPEGEPSAQQYADLIDYIKSEHIKAVFGEAGFNPKLVKQLAQDTGVKFVDNLYDDTVAPSGPINSYIAMMQYDAKIIAAALK